MIAIRPPAIEFSTIFSHSTSIGKVKNNLDIDKETKHFSKYMNNNCIKIKAGPIRVGFWSVFYGADIIYLSLTQNSCKITTVSSVNLWSTILIGLIVSYSFTFSVSKNRSFLEMVLAFIFVFTLGYFTSWIYHAMIVSRIKYIINNNKGVE
jgi:hypothetical protein